MLPAVVVESILADAPLVYRQMMKQADAREAAKNLRITIDARDFARFHDALLRFIKLERRSLADGLRFQGRKLGERVMDFTPPKTQAQGRAAVARQVPLAVKPLNERSFSGSDRTSKRIRTLIRRG